MLKNRALKIHSELITHSLFHVLPLLRVIVCFRVQYLVDVYFRINQKRAKGEEPHKVPTLREITEPK